MLKILSMSDTVFVVLFLLVFLSFGAFGLVALAWPSLVLRMFPNPFMPNTPWNRVWVRGIGLILCLFVLTALSGGFEGFHENILLALGVSFFALPVLMWLLWRFSVRSLMRQCYTNGTYEDPSWERRMTLLFCSILVFTVAVAWLLAARGYFIPIKKTPSGNRSFGLTWAFTTANSP